MREIKFRGKSIKDGKWYYGYFLVNHFGEHTICGKDFAVQVIPETVGQFTGLLNKNKKEIYEGDIISIWVGAPWDDEVPIQIKGVVEFETTSYWFKGIEANSEDDLLGEFLGAEIIGNIYSNPELLVGMK